MKKNHKNNNKKNNHTKKNTNNAISKDLMAEKTNRLLSLKREIKKLQAMAEKITNEIKRFMKEMGKDEIVLGNLKLQLIEIERRVVKDLDKVPADLIEIKKFETLRISPNL